MVEYWVNKILAFVVSDPLFHHSNIPFFLFFLVPTFHYSILQKEELAND